jgi:hypothetical protein
MQVDPSKIQFWLLVVQALTLVAIVIYVWKTWSMANATRQAAEASKAGIEEMRRAREEESRPYVLATIQLKGRLLKLLLKNFGRRPASNVHVVFDPSLDTVGDGFLSKEDGEKLLRPTLMPSGFEIEQVLGGSLGFLKDKSRPRRLDVTISYSNASANQQYTERYVIDLSPIFDNRSVEKAVEDCLEDVVKELNKLNTNIERLLGGIYKE